MIDDNERFNAFSSVYFVFPLL